MNLRWLAWDNLPWVKADAGQWRYALRNAIAMCLALSIACGLDLDEPYYWAMTSAAPSARASGASWAACWATARRC
nr:p-hydroxybenzoic acid efflux subunit AaeA [Candidatus Pantoea persica]